MSQHHDMKPRSALEGGATFVQMPLREFCHGLAVLNDERLGIAWIGPGVTVVVRRSDRAAV